jgi:hypothetical protein
MISTTTRTDLQNSRPASAMIWTLADLTARKGQAAEGDPEGGQTDRGRSFLRDGEQSHADRLRLHAIYISNSASCCVALDDQHSFLD